MIARRRPWSWAREKPRRATRLSGAVLLLRCLVGVAREDAECGSIAGQGVGIIPGYSAANFSVGAAKVSITGVNSGRNIGAIFGIGWRIR